MTEQKSGQSREEKETMSEGSGHGTQQAEGGKPGFFWSIAAVICAFVALLIPFIGIAGAALGAVGYWKGGGVLAAVSIGASLVGMIFGAIFLSVF